MIDKNMLIGDINNFSSYLILHNSINILDKKLLSINIIEEICLISWEDKNNTYWHLKILEKNVNLAFYIQIIIEGIGFEIVKLKATSLQSGVLKRYNNIGFYKGSFLQNDQVLKTLDKQYQILIINIFINQNKLK